VHPIIDHLTHTRARPPIGVVLIGLLALGLRAPGLAGQLRVEDAVPPSTPAAFAAATDAFRPDTVLTPRGGPKLIRLSAPGSGLTTLRLSIPIEETPIEAGTGLMLQMLGLDRARAAGSTVGVRVEGSRTPWGIAYTVVGPSEEFDYLAFLLREAVAEPRPDRVELERARARAVEEAMRTSETGPGRLAKELRAAAIPGSIPLSGTPTTLEGVTEATLRDLWRRSHRREAMSLIMVGPEPLELVLASFEDVGSGARSAGLAPTTRTVREPPATRPEVLRQWYGEARIMGDVHDPRGAVVAALVSRKLRETRGSFESDVQLWDIGNVRVLAVSGASYPAGAAIMKRRVQGILAEATTGIRSEDVSPAVSSLRFELLAAARTPWGLAQQVGRYMDATGEPDAAYQNMLALDRVTPDVIRLYVADLQRRAPATAELRP
jgi:hypothetical protein